MIHIKLHLLLNRLALCFLLSGLFIIPANAYDFSSGVFEFQQKLAHKGNPQAQYKLGNMYENGQGVKINLDEAAKWYKKSAAQKNASAKMRLTYIDIKKNGYSKSKHQSWLKKLQKDAKAKDGESLLLLGSMHKKGIVVKKDLKKSASLFKSASIRNVPGAETELETVNTLIYNNKYKNQQRASSEKAKAKQEQAQKDKVKKEKQLAKERKKSAEQHKKQQVAAQQRAQRERLNEQDRKNREAAERKRQEQIKQEQIQHEEQRKAAALAAEQSNKAKEKKKAEEEKIEADPLVDKSRCKGKKARFLTMCR